uniref:Integrase_H2C2 domain-containing protein n=1 Tax=Syphacia muris TaxID=451379 RepID=A0A0N5B0T3_9BILA
MKYLLPMVFDTGCQGTYIDAATAKELELPLGIVLRTSKGLQIVKVKTVNGMAGTFPRIKRIRLNKDGGSNNIMRREYETRIDHRDDQGIWRTEGRFGLLPQDQNPIYIPREHPIVRQLVMDERSGHMGSAHTTTKFRSKYWIQRAE